MKPSEERTILGDKEVDNFAALEGIADDEAVIGAIMGKLMSQTNVLAPESERMKKLLLEAQMRHAQHSRHQVRSTLR